MFQHIFRITTCLCVCWLTAHTAWAEGCKRGRKTEAELSHELAPGRYRLTLVARLGSRSGHTVEGELTLRNASKTDRSPRTGEIAQDLGGLPAMWGWTNAAVEEAGVPLCHEETPPDSVDPLYPGVLVLADRFGLPHRPRGAPVLLVATASNRRDGTITTDGCGVGLFIRGVRKGMFWGSWREWGIARDGRGWFCLEPLQATPLNPAVAADGLRHR